MDQRDLEQSSLRSLEELFAIAFEAPEPIQRQLGEYRLLEKLGEGGMGTVYKALHIELDRLVALKVLRPGLIDAQEASQRFTREIKVAGQLDHPHIVRAYDARRIGQTQFLVMEYVDGVDLHTLSNRIGPLPLADACDLIRQAALGLQCAHEHGLVHRDIKPSNLMLNRKGQVKILDLGLARLAEQNPATWNMTATGQMMGTPDYIAPEQVHDSRQTDIRSDVYSLGCTFFKLLTGHAPFSGPEYQTLWQKLSAHVNSPLPPLVGCRSKVPQGLEAVLQRTMAKDPAERFSTPGELALALAPFTAGCDLHRLITESEGTVPTDKAPRSTADTSLTASDGTPLSRWPAKSTPQKSPQANPRRRWGIVAALICVFAIAVVWGGLALRNRRAAQPIGDQTAATKEQPKLSSPIRPPAELPGWIVLSWTRPGLGKPHLWLIRPDGTGRYNLTNDPRYFDVHPKFSPDGRRIAFIRGIEQGAPNELWICNTNGGDCRRIVAAEGKSQRLASPVWIANSRIYYVRDPAYNRVPDFDVWHTDLDGAKPERAFRFVQALGKRSGLLTDVSPDGRQLAVIAFADARSSGSDVFTCDLDGGAVRKVWVDSGENCSDGRALWSPDGRMIAWHHNFAPSTSDGQTVIYYGVGIASSEPDGVWAARLQADQKNFVTPLAWSPDGKLLLCARIYAGEKRAAPANLFCMNPQFGAEQSLFDLDTRFWQPDKRDLGRLADWAYVPDDALPTPSNKDHSLPAD